MKLKRLFSIGATLLFILTLGGLCLAEAELYSPQLSFGKNASGSLEGITLVTFINSSTSRQSASYQYFSNEGNPLRTRMSFSDGTVIEGEGGSIGIPAKSAMTVRLSECRSSIHSDCASTGIRTGWARFSVPDTASSSGYETASAETMSLNPIEVQLIYQTVDREGQVLSSVGVPIETPAREFLLHSRVVDGVDLGFAIANPTQQAATISVELTEYGRLVALEEIELGPGEQLARFISELFNGVSVEDGTITVKSNVAVTVLGLRADYGPGRFLVSGIPIFR